MDRTINPEHSPLRAAGHLLSPSELIEPARSSHALDETIAALAWLGQLETLAASSLVTQPQAQSQPQTHPQAPHQATSTHTQPAPASAPASAPLSAPLAARRGTTSRPEYKPALRDRHLVEALLKLERSSGLRPKPAPAPETQKFVSTNAPEVQAVPKPSPMRWTSGSTQSVLRPAPDEST